MTMSRHPSPELMARFVAGTLSPAAALVVESHLALCGDCAASHRDMLAVAGVLLGCLIAWNIDGIFFIFSKYRFAHFRVSSFISQYQGAVNCMPSVFFRPRL